MAQRIRRGDMVVVIAGKERHKPIKERAGKVLRVYPDRQRALVEGLNVVKKHRRAQKQGEESGIVDQPAPIALSNLMLLCPETGLPTRIRNERASDGSLQRISKKSTSDAVI